MTQAATELAANSKQLHNAQNKLNAQTERATRRAEEAEKIQGNLQAEGTNLMRSLNEMRPKIVELTNTQGGPPVSISHLWRFPNQLLCLAPTVVG